jgi:hypothetical protein
VAKLLLEKGVGVDTKSSDGCRHKGTPLYAAVGRGHEAVVKLLVEKVADFGGKG